MKTTKFSLIIGLTALLAPMAASAGGPEELSAPVSETRAPSAPALAPSAVLGQAGQTLSSDIPLDAGSATAAAGAQANAASPAQAASAHADAESERLLDAMRYASGRPAAGLGILYLARQRRLAAQSQGDRTMAHATAVAEQLNDDKAATSDPDGERLVQAMRYGSGRGGAGLAVLYLARQRQRAAQRPRAVKMLEFAGYAQHRTAAQLGAFYLMRDVKSAAAALRLKIASALVGPEQSAQDHEEHAAKTFEAMRYAHGQAAIGLGVAFLVSRARAKAAREKRESQ